MLASRVPSPWSPKRAVLEKIRSSSLRNGYWLRRATSDQMIVDLIKSLRPKVPIAPMKRFGPAGDGGYVMPDDLDGIGALISPGVSFESGFDNEIANLGIDVHMADASVVQPSTMHERFKFTKVFLDTYNSDNTVTLDDYCRPISPGKDLLLQIDIEGAEYRVFSSASPELMSRFRIMVVEFHDMTALFEPFGFQEISAVFRKLLHTHNVVHIHPNNIGGMRSKGSIEIPTLLEFTFYRKDRPVADGKSPFPNPLDSTNVPTYPEVPLPAIWR